MQLQLDTMNFQNAFDRMENGTTFIGTEIFPAVLHSMLDEVEEKGYAHIVSWQPHGRCFVVHDRKQFVQWIMPAYFRMSKFASFQRQLNLYDYKRITAGPDKGGYYHENFVRGRKGLCKYILRQQVKGTLTRKPAPESEPDFYRLGMVRCINTEKMPLGHQDDLIDSTSLSELMLNSRVCQSNANRASSIPAPSMFPYNLTTTQGFSNTPSNRGAIGGQQYSKTTFDDLQGPSSQSLLAVMRSAPRFPQFCDESSSPTFHNSESEYHSQETNRRNAESQSVVSMLRPTRYAIFEDSKLYQVSNQEQVGYGGNASVVSMLYPSRYPRSGEPQHNFKMNHVETRFAVNEQTSKSYCGDFDNVCFESFENSFFPSQTTDTPVDESHAATENKTFFNEGGNFDWMPQKVYH